MRFISYIKAAARLELRQRGEVGSKTITHSKPSIAHLEYAVDDHITSMTFYIGKLRNGYMQRPTE